MQETDSTSASVPLLDYNRLQMREMERHKWIESEKAGQDLGEACLIDWIRRHGASFRKEVYHKKVCNSA